MYSGRVSFSKKISNDDVIFPRNDEKAIFRSKPKKKHNNNDSCEKNYDGKKKNTTEYWQRPLRVVTIVSLQSLQSHSRKR